MPGSRKKLVAICAAIITVVALSSCDTVNDERIPSLPVNINLSPTAMWDAYGVTAFGSSRRFVPQLHEPSGFAWLDRSAAGYGGVLLVCGINPFTSEAAVPVAFDLSCPVERQPDVRVRMQPTETFPEAVCPECGSVYDVIERGGVATAGPALSDRYGLRRYEVIPANTGGYLIIN